MRIACAVLAGGKSSRMGADKALLKIRGETFLDILCRTLEETGIFEEKIVAVGRRILPKREGWQQVEDIYPERGPMAGIHGVLAASSADAVFFISCDMPLITGDLVERICQRLSYEEVVVVKTRDGRCHPLCGIYKTSLYNKSEKAILSQNYRMLELLEQSDTTWLLAKEEEEICLTNINTPEEYLELIGRLKGVGK